LEEVTAARVSLNGFSDGQKLRLQNHPDEKIRLITAELLK
jgi:hypothetical protein